MHKGGSDNSDPPIPVVNHLVVETASDNFHIADDMAKVLMQDNKGDYYKLPCKEFPIEFTAAPLVEPGSISHGAWQSLMVHIGALTFDPDSPATHLKIPSGVGADRIARAICERHRLKRYNALYALRTIVTKGNIQFILSMYRTIMSQTARHENDFSRDETTHRDRMCGILLKNHGIKTTLEYEVQKRSRCPTETTPGYIDICLDTASRRTVVELKCARLDRLSLKAPGVLLKAEKLANMPLEKVLALKFVSYDEYRPGKTIQEWIDGEVQDQLFSYGLSGMNSVSDDRIFRAFAVVLIGERRILFAEAYLSKDKSKDEGKGYRWTASGIEEARDIAETKESAEIKGE